MQWRVRIDIRENTKFLPGRVMASDMGESKTWTLSIARCSKKLENATFRKLDLFPSSGEERETCTVGPLTSISKQPMTSRFKSYVTTDGHSASLSWNKAPSGAYDQIFITIRRLRVCWWGALSLTRGRVCRLQLLLALASAVILGSESRGTRDHILLSQIRYFSFGRLLRLAELRWKYSNPYNYSYINTWLQAISKWDKKKICKKIAIKHAQTIK
jgi:hypothetical protein